jgi:hypothetical protein
MTNRHQELVSAILTDIRQMPALQIVRIVFTEQGAACRGLLLLRHSCRLAPAS